MECGMYVSRSLKPLTHPHFSDSPYVLFVPMVGVGSYVPIEAVCYPVGMLMCQRVPDILSFSWNHIMQIGSEAIEDRQRDGQTLRCQQSLSTNFAHAPRKGEVTFVPVYAMTA